MKVLTDGPVVPCRECGKKVLPGQPRYLIYICDQPFCGHQDCIEKAALKAKTKKEETDG